MIHSLHFNSRNPEKNGVIPQTSRQWRMHRPTTPNPSELGERASILSVCKWEGPGRPYRLFPSGGLGVRGGPREEEDRNHDRGEIQGGGTGVAIGTRLV